MSDPKKLLDELYALDPSLREHEEKLLPLLERLVAAKPRVDITTHFVNNLRNRLMFEPSPVTKRAFPLRTLSFAAAFAVLALAVAIPASQYLAPSAVAPTGLNVATRGYGAFGELTANQQAGGMGGGGTRSAAEGSAVSSDTKLIAPGEYYPSTKYIYGYEGDITLPGATGTVYKRTGGLQVPSSISEALATADLGLINLNKFENLGVQHLTLREDANGYTVSADLLYGNVFISINEAYWQRIDSSKALTESQIASKESVVATAQAFLNEYGITTTGYGNPIVSDVQYTNILASARANASYVQDYINVSWPILINGTPVLNSDGTGHGITATVSLRTNEVTSVSLFATSSVDASSYDLETDTARIQEIVERGGLYGWQPETADATVNVALGEPSLVLTVHSTWNATTNRAEEMYVPALSFPITEAVEGVYSNSIVVPLVQSILDSVSNEPIYRILETEGGAASTEAEPKG